LSLKATARCQNVGITEDETSAHGWLRLYRFGGGAAGRGLRRGTARTICCSNRIDGPGTFVQTNITGTFVLVEAARAYFATLDGERHEKFRFHHVSTMKSIPLAPRRRWTSPPPSTGICTTGTGGRAFARNNITDKGWE
jgi:hypothetical protein